MAMGLSFKISASTFGPLPTEYFGPKGNLSCTSKENCKVPSYRSLQKIAEDFLNFSKTRLESLDKIESEVRSGIQLYEQTTEEVFSRKGHGAEKSFLEKGSSLYNQLPSQMGLSAARQIVSNNSPFLNELRALEALIKDAEINIINAITTEQKKDLKTQRELSYLNFRNSNKFQSYNHLSQVKILIEHYEINESISPWLNQKKLPLRLKFEDCPVVLRRIIKKKSPAIKYDLKNKSFQFDIYNSPKMLSNLVQNGRILGVKCVKKESGALHHSTDSIKAGILIEYNLNQDGDPILPAFN